LIAEALGDVRPDKVNCRWRPAALPNNGWGRKEPKMALSKQVAAKKAQDTNGVRINPEIDAKLDRYIQENPKLHEYYEGLSKEQLIRKLMLGKMQRAEVATRRNQELVGWVNENPEVKARIEERIKNVPVENRERAFVNAARTEAMSQGIRSTRVRP
jgi:hypothetical protein